MNHVTTYIRQSLHDIYPPGELRSLTKIICCDLLGQDAIDYYLGKDITLSANEQCDLESIVERLKKNEPIQYIQGETCFYGSMFRVAPVAASFTIRSTNSSVSGRGINTPGATRNIDP